MAIHARKDGSSLSSANKKALVDAVKGRIVFKDEAPADEYDPLIKRWNEAHTSRAVSQHFFQYSISTTNAQQNIIALPETDSDISACVKFANQHYLDLAVAGGRHAYYGASSSDGMVIGTHATHMFPTRSRDTHNMLDLRNFRNVSIDKAAMKVTAGGGCLAEDVEIPCEKEGIMVGFGAINETGSLLPLPPYPPI